MSGLLSFLSIISFIVLLIGIIVWFIRRKTTNRSFSKQSKKLMWASLAIYIISLVGGGIADESEPAEIQPLVQAEDVEKDAVKESALAEAKELKAEEARLAEEKKELLAQEKTEEERLAAEKKVAEAKAAEQAVADQKAAEEKAAAEQLALEQKAAEEKAAAERVAAEQASQKAAASVSVSSETFQNCTELRKVYPGGVPAGHAAYQSKMDRDNDDYACEA